MEREMLIASETVSQSLQPYFKWVGLEEERVLTMSEEMASINQEIRGIRKSLGDVVKVNHVNNNLNPM